jgi:hypothetical protein
MSRWKGIAQKRGSLQACSRAPPWDYRDYLADLIEDREEPTLRQTFGEDYATYCRQARRCGST